MTDRDPIHRMHPASFQWARTDEGRAHLDDAATALRGMLLDDAKTVIRSDRGYLETRLPKRRLPHGRRIEGCDGRAMRIRVIETHPDIANFSFIRDGVMRVEMGVATAGSIVRKAIHEEPHDRAVATIRRLVGRIVAMLDAAPEARPADAGEIETAIRRASALMLASNPAAMTSGRGSIDLPFLEQGFRIHHMTGSRWCESRIDAAHLALFERTAADLGTVFDVRREAGTNRMVTRFEIRRCTAELRMLTGTDIMRTLAAIEAHPRE